MANVVDINTRDVQNLINGNVAGDQIGGSKFGGDQVSGDKITVAMHNIMIGPATIGEFGLKSSDNNTMNHLQRIAELVSIMMLAEVQERNLSSPTTSFLGLSDIRNALEEFHKLHYTGTLETSTGSHSINLCDLFPLVANSQATLHYYSSMRNIRRRREGNSLATQLRKSRQLRDWVAQSGSSQLVVKGSFRSRHVLRDFAADMIDLLHAEKRLVAWVLQYNSGKSEGVFEIVDVVKQLVRQVVQQNSGIVTERGASLTARRVQNASSVDDWFSLLGSVLNGVREVYLLLDTAAFSDPAQEYQWSLRFDELFNELRERRIPSTLRVVFINYRQTMSRRLQASPATVIDVNSPQVGQRLQSQPWRSASGK
ncbi:uncharacterized protein BO97DRAFT_469372 [Aspergillus homomorphus CBS 101889]|uniref:Uncharacterized protein n=1 Tax=Aspergillus homomorphus (strain CBS 101889) TaxID=1450537 RepID=A0A395I2C4_ASPHC|nr:hypothetical protein BO97DRAFT_469372 [Aspergillus homomorphus CBS 101889]RAL14097.1 hypothetical protein BO97DRAFT_469372 [Aspergillus homomorphus CBS 101889]